MPTSDSSQPEANAIRASVESLKHHQQLRVLVVDDVSVMRLLVRNNLRSIGIENVMLATNGREAVDLLGKWRFDLVLTDWSMPLMDGLELLIYIRRSERHREVPVILITAEGERSQVRTAIKAGVTDFLIKPFTLGIFQRKVERAIRRALDLGLAPAAGMADAAAAPLIAPPLSAPPLIAPPLDEPPLGAPPPVSAPEPAPRFFADAPRLLDAAPTILAVDDAADNIRLITQTLRDTYRVKGAKSGAKALEIARSDDPPHLILLDIMMPEMDGFEVLRQLKADPATADIPVIFLTAKTAAEDVIVGLDLGAVDYVPKPTNPAVLKARIRTQLRLDSQQRALREQSAMALENARLREEVERMGRHDIKNPLNAVLALARELATDDNLRPEQRESLAAIQDSARYVLGMVNHSLALQRMEMGTYQLDPEDLALAALLDRVVGETREAFGGLQVVMRQSVPGPVAVRGEALLCHALFANLMRNAAEAAPPDSLIAIDILPEPASVTVQIHNQGAVPEPLRDRFFEKYATWGKKQGTGIGTYSAKLMAETQGGSIRMETADETGTTLSVTLPRAVVPASPATGRGLSDPPAALADGPLGPG